MPSSSGTTPAADGRQLARFRTANLLRNRYFLWWRLSVRFVEAASLVALGRDVHGLGVAAVAACALYDVGLSAWLRRSGRMAFWPRLALDAVDVALWSQAIGSSPDVAALAASPLALEAGLQLGWRGLVVPLAVGGLSAAVSLAAGQPPSLAPFLWPLVAVTLAALAVHYLRLRLDRQLRSAEQEIEAAASRAELAGQNSVAAGADSIVDLLSRTTPLLAAGGVPLPPSRLAAWKLALAEASAGQASYLGVVVTRWQRLHNSMSPDLAADVELRCPEGVGTLLLSPAQTRELERALDRLTLVGGATVEVPSPAPAGRQQVLLVGGRRVVLPADPRPAAPSLDLGPIALLLAAFSVLTHSPPRSEAVPLQVTVPLAVAACLLALWAHELVDRRGPAAHPAVLAAALALGGADSILSTLTMHNRYTDHMARFPFLLFLTWFGPLFVVYARDLSERARWLALGGAAAIVAAGFALMPEAPPVTHLVAGAVWPTCAFLVSVPLRDVLDEDARDLAAALATRYQAEVDRAYRLGRRLVVDLVAAASGDARGAYRQVRSGLPGDVAEEFERRLADVDGRLCGLREADERAAGEAASEVPAGDESTAPETAAGALRHVTVRGANGRVELVVPGTAAIRDVLPALARLRGGSGEAAWTLAKAGEPALSPASSVADAGIRDGDVLHVVEAGAAGPTEAVAQAVIGAGGRWTPESWAWLIAVLAVAALLAAAGLAVWTRTARDETGQAALALAVAMVAAGAGLRTRPGRPSVHPALLALVAGAWVLAALGGWGVAGAPRPPDGLAAAALALAGIALATYPVLPAAAPGAALAAATLAVAIAALQAGVGPVPVAAVAAVAGVALLRTLPGLVGRALARLAAGPRLAGSPAALQAAARRCRELLASLSAGTALVVLGALLVLLARGDGLAVALAGVLMVSLLLQARAYRFASEVLPPALAAGLAAVALGAALGARSIAAGGDPLGPIVLLVATCLALIGLAATWPELRFLPRLPAVTWVLVDAALAPLALAELGAFGAVARLVRHLLP